MARTISTRPICMRLIDRDLMGLGPAPRRPRTCMGQRVYVRACRLRRATGAISGGFPCPSSPRPAHVPAGRGRMEFGDGARVHHFSPLPPTFGVPITSSVPFSFTSYLTPILYNFILNQS
jgi:hypothetical protein